MVVAVNEKCAKPRFKQPPRTVWATAMEQMDPLARLPPFAFSPNGWERERYSATMYQSIARDSLREIRARMHASNCLPFEKKFAKATIFLDTEFHQIYTFDSCMLWSCSIDVISIGRIDTWQPRKQPRRPSRRQQKRQPKRSNPTQGKRRTGDAHRVPRSAFVCRLLPRIKESTEMLSLPAERSSAWKDTPRPCFCRCC